MNEQRKNQLIASLRALGPKAHTLYTKQDIIDLLIELQRPLAKGVFDKTHTENIHDRDMMIYFSALAKVHGLDQTETYRRFKANMANLCYTIGTYIKGKNGEKIAKRALKLLEFEKGVRILYNVQLEDEDTQAEYDAIVIAPYGMFVIEVKNWDAPMVISTDGLLTREDGSGIIYDLPGRMSVKEALLREHLKDLFPKNYHSLLLLSSARAQLRDDYRKVPISRGGGVTYEIRSFSGNDEIMDEEQIKRITEEILSQHKEQRMYCPVNCEEIIEDYASLMAQIEATSEDMENVSEVTDDTQISNEIEEQKPTPRPWFKRIPWSNVACFSVAALPGIAAAIALNKH